MAEKPKKENLNINNNENIDDKNIINESKNSKDINQIKDTALEQQQKEGDTNIIKDEINNNENKINFENNNLKKETYFNDILRLKYLVTYYKYN